MWYPDCRKYLKGVFSCPFMNIAAKIVRKNLKGSPSREMGKTFNAPNVIKKTLPGY
jgi:hypothetical protein